MDLTLISLSIKVFEFKFGFDSYKKEWRGMPDREDGSLVSVTVCQLVSADSPICFWRAGPATRFAAESCTPWWVSRWSASTSSSGKSCGELCIGPLMVMASLVVSCAWPWPALWWVVHRPPHGHGQPCGELCICSLMAVASFVMSCAWPWPALWWVVHGHGQPCGELCSSSCLAATYTFMDVRQCE